MVHAHSQRGQRIVAPDMKFQIAGKDFGLACKVDGVDSTGDHLRNELLPALMNALDTSKPMNTEVVRVIGGGDSPWAAVELLSTGTSKKGEPWHHESVTVLRFNEDGKIAEAKGYFDTLYLHNRMEECK